MRITKKGIEVERMLRVPQGVYESLTKQAQEDHRSINAQVVVAIEEHLARRKR